MNLCSTQNIYGKASLVAHTGVQSLCQTTSEGTERQRDKERKQQQKTGMTTKANKKQERDRDTIRYDKQRHMKTQREKKQTQVWWQRHRKREKKKEEENTNIMTDKGFLNPTGRTTKAQEERGRIKKIQQNPPPPPPPGIMTKAQEEKELTKTTTKTGKRERENNPGISTNKGTGRERGITGNF